MQLVHICVAGQSIVIILALHSDRHAINIDYQIDKKAILEHLMPDSKSLPAQTGSNVHLESTDCWWLLLHLSKNAAACMPNPPGDLILDTRGSSCLPDLRKVRFRECRYFIFLQTPEDVLYHLLFVRYGRPPCHTRQIGSGKSFP